jgi:hypothetical protein
MVAIQATQSCNPEPEGNKNGEKIKSVFTMKTEP